MILFIASDIHGSAYWCRKMLEAYKVSGAERLVLLGDILYHGPRNDLPSEYAPKEVIAMLNPLAEKIIAVRGNCDAEVDQMVLDFSVMSDSAIIFDAGAGVTMNLTHGHMAGENNPPPMSEGTVLVCGHTHVPADRACGRGRYINPGSVSIPKEGSAHSYIIYENGEFGFGRL